MNMYTSLCIQIVHVGTCSSLNEVEQHVVRGSIGLADTEGAGTPLTQGQDIPLTGAKKEEEGGEDMSETERRGDTEETFQFCYPHFLPSWEVEKGQNREGDAKSERQKGQSRENKSEWECVRDSVCIMHCHADDYCSLSNWRRWLSGKGMFSGGMIP